MSQNPPTARAGIRASSAAQEPPADEQAPQPETAADFSTGLQQSHPKGSLMNPEQSLQAAPQEEVHSTLDLSIALDSGAIPADRRAVIREALYAHRAVLHGLVARKENEHSLNPASKQETVKLLKQGILNAEIVLGELGPEQEGQEGQEGVEG